MVTITLENVYSMGERNGCRTSNRFMAKNIATFTAWVLQMFTCHQIGYAVEMAFVTINIKILWLQLAESAFLMVEAILGG
jgi:hypothetical protein